jgi:hypothetical protein
LIFLLHVSQLKHQKVVKSAKKMWEKVRKMRKSAKCDARKWNQNSHRIVSHYYRKKNRIFALFRIAFASHYHPWWQWWILTNSKSGCKVVVTILVAELKATNSFLPFSWWNYVCFPPFYPVSSHRACYH